MLFVLWLFRNAKKVFLANSYLCMLRISLYTPLNNSLARMLDGCNMCRLNYFTVR